MENNSSPPLTLQKLDRVFSPKAIQQLSNLKKNDKEAIAKIIAQDWDASDGTIDGSMHRLTLTAKLDDLAKLICDGGFKDIQKSLSMIQTDKISVAEIAAAISGFVLKIKEGKTSSVCLSPEFIPNAPLTTPLVPPLQQKRDSGVVNI